MNCRPNTPNGANPNAGRSPARPGGSANVDLTAEDLRKIERALAEIKVQGDRYPAHLAARLGK
jgi:hypothetical protein